MTEWVDMLSEGAVLVTGSERLARDYRLRYDEEQQARGLQVWTSPTILSWNSWLASLWNTLLVTAEGPLPTLLGRRRERAVWESIVRSSPQADRLISLKGPAATASEAWQLLRQYQLPLRREEFSEREDTEVFLEWAERFQQRRRDEDWLDVASLADYLLAAVESGVLEPPPGLILAGFDEYTPQQRQLFDALRRNGCRQHEVLSAQPRQGNARTLKCRNRADELRSAAWWARAVLERDPDARILVVVPQLSACLAEVEHAFLDALHPQVLAGEGLTGAKAFHVSLGRPLSQAPIAASALLLLGLVAGRVPLTAAGQLLRSPFLGGASTEGGRRALLDVALRDDGMLEISLGHLLARATEERAWQCPALSSALSRFQRALDQMPESLAPSRWCEQFSRLLAILGWPGDSKLDSVQYQTMEAWNDVLSELSRMDLASGAVSAMTALDYLRDIADETIFQPENEGPPIQIAGALEVSGQEADFLWVLGLHAEEWPPPSRPNPFVPLRLQRRHNLPHSSPGREYEFARLVTDRLLVAAPEVVLSYPAREGDRELRPSPLLAAIPECRWEDLNVTVPGGWFDASRRCGTMESLVDEHAPGLPPGTNAAGGTNIFKLQAACPFRAFAELRLGAASLPSPSLGIDPRTRGILVHRCLQSIWAALKTKEALDGADESALQELVRGTVSTVIGQFFARLPAPASPALQAMEQERLEALLHAWLESERQRPGSFEVAVREKRRQIALGGLEVETFVDRVDRLPDGRLDRHRLQVHCAVRHGLGRVAPRRTAAPFVLRHGNEQRCRTGVCPTEDG